MKYIESVPQRAVVTKRSPSGLEWARLHLLDDDQTQDDCQDPAQDAQEEEEYSLQSNTLNILTTKQTETSLKVEEILEVFFVFLEIFSYRTASH